MGYELSTKSLKKLEGVHQDLVDVVKLAISRTDQDFAVGEGLRSLERQKKLLAAGKSKTLNSRHLTGHAVDLWVLADGKVNWEMPRYKKLADLVLECAKELGKDVEWGGGWKKFEDGPHFQLSRKSYP